MEAITYLLQIISRVFAAIGALVSFFLGALLDPPGCLNWLCCKFIDLIDVALPATPPEFQISNLLASLSSGVPLVGYGVFQLIAFTIFQMFLIVIVIKIYKLIPFKAT